MDTRELQNKLLVFTAALPDSVRQAFKSRSDFDVVLAVSAIGEQFELTIKEIHWLYESVRRVLAGEDSPSNLAAFISEDERIEEDNRGKIPAIAQEIQKQIFDPVLPLLRQAGMTVKEGRVATASQPIGPISPVRPIGQIGQISSIGPIGQIRPTPPQSSPPGTPSPRGLGTSPLERGSGGGEPPLDERHLRALARIAAGTTHTEEQLVEQFQTLPDGLKRAITTVDTANAIQEIAKKFLLHIDQMAALASETGLVLLGLTHPRDFVKNLARRLRISETRALEIAREVSEQILVKVRDTLRGLHEEKPKSQAPSSKQTPIPSPPNKLDTPPQSSPLKRGGGAAEPAKKLGVLEEQTNSSSEKLSAKSYQLKASLNTPYSPSAKWETGEANNQQPTTDNQQQTDREENLTREEVLRGIEQLTTDNRQPTTTTPPQSSPPGTPSPRGLGTSPLERGSGGGGEVVGPTGWRPPARNGNTKYQISNTEKYRETERPKEEKNPPAHQNEPPPLRKEEYTPTPPSIPPLGKVEEENATFLEQKLAGPTGAAHEEKRYTIDPYREPAE